MDIAAKRSDNSGMQMSVEEIVARHMKAARKVSRKLRDPAKAREFLIRAGIAEKSKSSPNGIRLVKALRSE